MKTFFTAVVAAVSYLFAEPSESDLSYYGRSPPVYPSPEGTGKTPGWEKAYSKARFFVSQLELEEKLNLTRGFPGGGNCVGNTGGIPRLGFSPLCLQDGPSGVRDADFVSAFPAGMHVAATWDRELMYMHGKAMGDEYHGKGVNVALAPCSGPLGRTVRGGRNWEGYGPDPYLAGVAFGQATKGIQDAGVIANPKHFLLNEQEWRRREGPEGEAISSNVDDRTIHELYAWPFMDALHAGAASIMCSYQRANHSYACQNSKMLNGILKTELGFEGFVVTDWRAQHSGVASIHAGLDMVMPNGGFWGSNLTQAVNNGSISTDRIDDMVTRIMAAYYYVGQDKSFPEVGLYPASQQHPIVDVQSDHAKVIREIGAAGHVLVKNVRNALPLKHPRYVSVFGYDAETKAEWGPPDRYGGGNEVNFGWETFRNGTLITAGGSGANSPAYVISPFKAIQDRVIADKGILRWDFWNESPFIEASSDVCLVFINAYASESFDRTTLADESSDRLVTNVASGCKNTIVVLHSAGARVVDAWVNHENVTAVIFAGLPGQESGNALVDVLYGDVSPSGRLPYTVAKREEDYGHLLNSTQGSGKFPEANFTEGVYIDYRAFDKDGIEPRFEFGFGLTYAEFKYSGLIVKKTATQEISYLPPHNHIVQGGNPAIWDTLYTVTCEITNAGNISAHEVAQLYIGIPDSPVRQLRGFDRVPLDPGETKSVVFAVTRRDLSIWDVITQQWVIQSGAYGIWVAASSRDLRLSSSLNI